MPVQIASSTASTATAYSSQRKIDRCQNGVMWAIFNVGSSINHVLKAAYSTDNGVTWTIDTPQINPTLNNSYILNASFFIDIDDYAHVVFKDPNNGYIYYRRGTPDVARTAWTWSATTTINGNSGINYPDIVAHREGTGWAAHVVYAQTQTPNDFIYYVKVDISSGGVISAGTAGTFSTASGNGNGFPSIDFNHTGDGKTVKDNAPHLYVAWSSSTTGAGKGIRFRKSTYSAGTWTKATEVEIDSTRYVATTTDWLNCLFDGTRVIMAGSLYDGTNRDVVLHERDAADTTTTTRVLLDNTVTADQLHNGSATYDGTGNVYLFGANTDEAEGSRNLVYRKWNRATTTLDAEVLIDSATTQANAFVSAKRGYSSNRTEFVYLDGTASPYQVKYSYVGDQSDINPGSVSTSTVITATGHSNERKIDRCQNGVLWAIWDVGSVGRYDLAYSTDNGASWTSAMGPNLPGGTGRTYGGACSLFIDIDDYAHLVFKDLANGSIYYFRGTPNAGRTAWTWNSATQIWAGTAMHYPDVVAFRDPASSGWQVCFVAGYLSGSATLAGYARVLVASNGTVGAIQRDNLQVLLSNDGALNSNLNGYNGYNTSRHTYPSIDFHHTGNGKTVKDGTPHIYAGWSAGNTGAGYGIRFRKATYSAGTWTWAAEREIDTAHYALSEHYVPTCMFDGTRCVIAGAAYDGANGNPDVIVHDRDVADTTTTTRVVYELAGGTDAAGLLQTSCSYDSQGNVYIFGRSTGQAAGSRFFHYRIWNRATATLGTLLALDSTGIGDPYVSVKRGYAGGRIEFLYMDGTASPYAITYNAVNINSVPAVPSSVLVTSATSDYTPVFSANISDPDTSDQVKARFDIQTSGGTPIGTVDSAYVGGGGAVTAEYLTPLAVGYYQVRAKAIDENLSESDYTTWVAFTINTAPGAPTIGGTQPVPMYRFNWTFSDTDAGDVQTRSEGEVRRQSDSVVVYSWDVSNDLQYHDVTASTFPTDTYEWRVRTYDSLGTVGAWSTYDTFTVSSSSNVSVYWNGSWVSSSGTTVS